MDTEWVNHRRAMLREADLREHLPAGRVGGKLSTEPEGADGRADRIRILVEDCLRVAHEEGYPQVLVELRALAAGDAGPTW